MTARRETRNDSRTEVSQSTLFDDLREAVASPDGARASGLPECGSGNLLRALLLVHGVLGLGLAFWARTVSDWLLGWSQAAMLAVPATLAWLVLTCLARPWLARWRVVWQSLWVSLVAVLVTAVVLLLLGRADLQPEGWRWPPCLLTAAALAAALHQVERWRARARLPLAAAARLADLQTRIRPHFLFNTLNTAIALVQVDPRRAEEVLEDLAELFRAALGTLDEATTLEAEIALGRRYLAIEALRFGERLKLDWQLDPQAAGARLPPLMLQPLLENAVRHGVEPSDRGGRIEVRTVRRRDRILISVTNSVPLLASRPGHGIGLASVRERLKLMYDLDADFRSGLIEDGRWRVSLSVPA